MATLAHFEAFLYEYSIIPKTLSHAVFTFLGHYFLKIFKCFHMEPGASNKLQNEGYSSDKSRADISPRLFQGYWATAYLPVAYC